MATTDSRTGFRLPWSTDSRQASEDGDEARLADGASDTSFGGESNDAESGASSTDAGQATDTAPEASAEAVPDAPAPVVNPMSGPVRTAAPSPSPSRKPNKFLADLTKAMQAAAETAREESLARLSADAKSFIEQIHERSGEEAAGLRNRADADIEEIREWSKAEIARIREETEQRITDRRSRLNEETERHAAQIEREIERVQARVADFEAEMARFFERLLAEEDPTYFASLAENLPEAPSFDVNEALAEAATLPTEEPAVEAAVAEPASNVTAETEAATDPWRGLAFAGETSATEAPDAPASEEAPDSATASDVAEIATDELLPADPSSVPDAEVPAETEGVAETADAPVETEAVTDPEAPNDPGTEGEIDPRLSVLGLNPEFAAAAEAEASAFDATSVADEVVDIPSLGEEAIAARLAGFMPDAETPSSEAVRTQVVVVGLVSVASIAGFKRQLGRLVGVQAVGVSSGPDGEFVFSVTHGTDASLADSIPTIPGFQARVTGTGDGVVNVTAHDPESDS